VAIHLVARGRREHSEGMLDDPLCPKTVTCDTCQQIAVVEIIHVGERREETIRGETTQRIPLTVNCPKCGRHRQPWRE
jgi:hypothetical protein